MYRVQHTDYRSNPYDYRNSRKTSAQMTEEGTQTVEEGTQTTETKMAKEDAGRTKGMEKSGESQDHSTKKKEEEDAKLQHMQDLITRMHEKTKSIQDAFDKKRQKNLYDATADLMAIQAAEKEPSLKAIHTRLLFEARMLRSSGAESGEIKIAVTKIKKVIGKLKVKIKNLKKEALMEKKAENARKAKQRKLEEAVRRELALRRKVRKEREQKDVEESRMGMGANYGGPGEGAPVSLELSGEMIDISSEQLLLEADMSGGGLAASFDAVAADMGGAAIADAGGSIDLSL